jgi:hypothetical protein
LYTRAAGLRISWSIHGGRKRAAGATAWWNEDACG